MKRLLTRLLKTWYCPPVDRTLHTMCTLEKSAPAPSRGRFLFLLPLIALLPVLPVWWSIDAEKNLKVIQVESRKISHEADVVSSKLKELNCYAKEIDARIITGSGEVTFYHDKFHGRIAKDGSRFSQQGHTFANNTLPMGTACFFLRGEKVAYGVKTDTGELYGRFADLPRDRFAEIAALSLGVANVEYVAILPLKGFKDEHD